MLIVDLVIVLCFTVAIDDIINEIKGGRFTLKATEVCYFYKYYKIGYT